MLNSRTRLAAQSWGVLVWIILVILWGALVRATGSGAGCGQHWPLCHGQMIPSLERYQTWIEYGHRASSGLSLIAVFWIGIRAFRAFRAGDSASRTIRRLAVFSMIGIVIEAAIGAALVLLRLVEHDQSVDRAISIALHLGNTCFLVGSLALLSQALSGVEVSWPESAKLRKHGLWVLIGFVVLAAAGAWTALGDTLFSVKNFQAGWVRDWAQDAHFLERLRILHPVLAAGWLVIAITWLQSLTPTRMTRLALGLILSNVAVGAFNVLLAAPLVLQILHLAVANSLWVSLILCFGRGERRGEDAMRFGHQL